MDRRPIRWQRGHRLPACDDGGPARGRDLDYHHDESDPDEHHDESDPDEHYHFIEFIVNDVVDHNLHYYILHHPRHDLAPHHNDSFDDA